VYGLTGEGRRELSVLRQRAAGQLDAAPDAVSVALVFAGIDDPAELATALARRRQALRAKDAELAAERVRGEAAGYLLPAVSPLQAAAFRRAEILVAAELAWHDECEALIAPPRDSATDPAGAP
jgi:hypothetical protein